MRQFSVVFGTSELAVATVLASYMAGLALGSYLASRFAEQVKRPVLTYGVLEALIAVSALCVPLFMAAANWAFIQILGGQEQLPDAQGAGQTLFYLAATFLVLLIPTTAMGATLPLLAKYVVNDDSQIGSRVGFLYSINTLGAIAGTLCAAFLLLPRAGLSGTIYVGVAINMLVFVLAWLLVIKLEKRGSHRKRNKDRYKKPREKIDRNYWVLPLIAGSGMVSFCYEVLWTRLLAHILGGSVAAFSTMLASFLGGIAIGSAIASRVANTQSAATTGFALAQLGTALISAVIYFFFDAYAASIEQSGLLVNVALCISVLLPAALCIGATFPFAVRIHTPTAIDAMGGTARVYAWNTAGAIIGALLAAYYLIPWLKFEGTIKVAVLSNVCLALATTLLYSINRRSNISPAFNHWRSGALIVIVAAGAIFYHPQWPENILRISALSAPKDGKVQFYEVGRSATVLIMENDGFLYLRNNGLPEAATSLNGAPPAPHSQAMLSILPVMARPDLDDMLIIGYGGGVVLENVPPSVNSVDVLELEPRVIDANRFMAPLRQTDPLQDERIRVVKNDARSAMQLTTRRYDAIVSQPSHPWTAGASHLYTQEFVQLAQSRLHPRGVFLQWMNAEFVDDFLLRSLSKTLNSVFAHVRIYQFETNVLFFLASDAPLTMEQEMYESGEPFASNPEYFRRQGLAAAEDALAALVMDAQGTAKYAEQGVLISDNDNLMASRSSWVVQNSSGLSHKELQTLIIDFSPLLRADSWVYQLGSRAGTGERLNLNYVSKRLSAMKANQVRDKLAKLSYEEKITEGLPLVSEVLRNLERTEQAELALSTAIKLNPRDHQSRYLLLEPYIASLDSAPEDFLSELPLLPSSAQAVLKTWRRTFEGEYHLAQQLDSVLESSQIIDAWFPRALKMRVDWRLKRMASGDQSVSPEKTLALIDSMIAINQDLDFYGMRFVATVIAKDTKATIETVRRLVRTMDQSITQQMENANDEASIAQLKSIAAAGVRRLDSIQQGIQHLRSSLPAELSALDDIETRVAELLKKHQEAWEA